MGMTMHRLQISLPEWQYRFLREQASRTGQSIAGLIRNLVEQEAQAVQRPVEEDPIWEVVGIGQGGRTAGNQHPSVGQQGRRVPVAGRRHLRGGCPGSRRGVVHLNATGPGLWSACDEHQP